MGYMDYDSFISIVKYESSKFYNELDSIKDNKLPKGKIFYLDYDSSRSKK